MSNLVAVAEINPNSPLCKSIREHLTFVAPEQFNMREKLLELMEKFKTNEAETLRCLTFILFEFYKGKYEYASPDQQTVRLSPFINQPNTPNFFRVSYVPPMVIEKEPRKELQVEITFFKNFHKFGVRLAENEMKYNEMNCEIQTMFSGGPQPRYLKIEPSQLRIGHAIVCLMNVANMGIEKYHRAIVIQVETEVKVYIIDVGVIEKPNLDFIYAMPSPFISIPPFAVSCSYQLSPNASAFVKRCLTGSLQRGGTVRNYYINYIPGRIDNFEQNDNFIKDNIITDKAITIASVEILVERNGFFEPLVTSDSN